MADKEPPYACTLDEETQKKAQEELYEDPKNRQGAIDTLREWVKQQNHMKCPTDDVFLLGFLRAKHFSQLESREAIERFMTLRDKMSSWTLNLDPASEEINEIIDTGGMLILPKRDDDNRRITIVATGSTDPDDKKKLTAFARLFVAAGYLHYLCDEMTQVHGTVFVMDFMKQTLANEMKVPMEFKKRLSSMLTKAFPARVKEMHMCNAGHVMEVIMAMISTMLTEKLKKRLHIHKHGLETLYDYVPMKVLPEEYLPDDYAGPNCGTQEKILEYMKERFREPKIRERIKYLSSEEFYINVKDKDTDVAPASFRKLSVD